MWGALLRMVMWGALLRMVMWDSFTYRLPIRNGDSGGGIAHPALPPPCPPAPPRTGETGGTGPARATGRMASTDAASLLKAVCVVCVFVWWWCWWGGGSVVCAFRYVNQSESPRLRHRWSFINTCVRVLGIGCRQGRGCRVQAEEWVQGAGRGKGNRQLRFFEVGQEHRAGLPRLALDHPILPCTHASGLLRYAQ